MSRRSTWTPERRQRENERKLERDAEKRRALNPSLPPYRPHALRGPSSPPKDAHYVPAGLELAGVSRLTGPDGDLKANWDKSRTAGGEPTPLPDGFNLPARISRMTRGDGSTVVEWQAYNADENLRIAAIRDAITAFVGSAMKPAAPVPAPESTNADLLVVYPLGDPHIGMLAWAKEVCESFDLKIAARELCECVRQLVARSPASEEAIVTDLGDFWHAENDRQATPKSGHKLDVDGRSGKVGEVGIEILFTLIDTALTKHARVRFRTIPGNHDPQSAFWIAQVIRAHYRNDPRVIVEEPYNPYQYDVFGRVLLGWAHGDGAKVDALGEIMATDVPGLWGAASFRYWHTGHRHHWETKELRGCVVDTHRTLAGRDAWHHHAGYRSGRALKAIAYHREWGLDSVAVVGVERVRAAIEGRAA